MVAAIFVNDMISMAGIIHYQESVVTIMFVHMFHDLKVKVQLCLAASLDSYNVAGVIVPK